MGETLQIQHDNAMLNRHDKASHLPAVPNRNRPQEGQVMAKKAIRPIRIEGNIAYVPLTQGYEAVIDADDAPLVINSNWAAQVKRRRDGSVRTVYAFQMRGGRSDHRMFYMHRVIAGVPEGMVTDHRDGDGLNNRRSNLRHATDLQNGRNMRLSAANTSGVKGVYWAKRERRWVAEIRADGKQCLGYFRSIEQAAAAYAKASAELHGEFGRVS
jgi:hypothetical protein